MEHTLDAIAKRETRRQRIAVGSVCAVAAIATLLPHSERGLLPWGRTPSAFAAMAGRGAGGGGGGGLTAPARLALSSRERLPIVAGLDPVSRAIPAGAVDYAARGDESGFVDEGVAGLTAPLSVSVPLALVAPVGVPAASGGGATTTPAGGLLGGSGGFAGGGGGGGGTVPGTGGGTGTTPVTGNPGGDVVTPPATGSGGDTVTTPAAGSGGGDVVTPPATGGGTDTTTGTIGGDTVTGPTTGTTGSDTVVTPPPVIGGGTTTTPGIGDPATTPATTPAPPAVTPTTPVSTVDAGVPEPATWAMLLLGFGAIGATLRRTRRRAATA